MRNFNSIVAVAMKGILGHGGREPSHPGASLLACAALLAVGSVAQAQTTAAAAPAASTDQSLTWHGITLYGVLDAGYQYESHGAPFNNYFIAGGSEIVQSDSNRPVSGLTSNGVSQSRIGLQGNEPLHFGDWAGVFKIESYFNPTTGQITDALKSVTQNNGRALAERSTGIDSSVAGQPFEQSLIGVSSPTYGTLTFGRQNSVLADLIAKYDPQQTSYAFSLLGLSGTPAGGGDTQDRRLDGSIKYDGHFFDLVHLAAIYKTQGVAAANYSTAGIGEAFNGWEVALGGQYAGGSIDFFYSKFRDAIAASVLSAAQVAALPAGISSNNAVAGTVANTASYGAAATYALGSVAPAVPVTLYAGFQHIVYSSPSIPLTAGFDDIGGYVLGAVSNTAYNAQDRQLNVFWAGARYAVTPQFTAALAYYGEKQFAYATGAIAGCETTVSGACGGNFNAWSLSFDYHFTKRFDTYLGAEWSDVTHGLANGYIETNNIDPTIGVRYSF